MNIQRKTFPFWSKAKLCLIRTKRRRETHFSLVSLVPAMEEGTTMDTLDTSLTASDTHSFPLVCVKKRREKKNRNSKWQTLTLWLVWIIIVVRTFRVHFFVITTGENEGGEGGGVGREWRRGRVWGRERERERPVTRKNRYCAQFCTYSRVIRSIRENSI